MNPLPYDISFDRVIPLVAIAMERDERLEAEVLAEIDEEGQLDEPSDEDVPLEEFIAEELSMLENAELAAIPEEIIRCASTGHGASLFYLSMRLAAIAENTSYRTDRAALVEGSLWLLRQSTDEGDPRAQWLMGERFSRMKWGLEEGVRLLGLSAAQDFTEARKRLRVIYDSRFSFEDEPSEIKWFTIYAKAGITDAKFELASRLYLKGMVKEAFSWMLKAAEAGHAAARSRVAFFYEIGDGCHHDRERAKFWHAQADLPAGRPSFHSPEPVVLISPPQADFAPVEVIQAPIKEDIEVRDEPIEEDILVNQNMVVISPAIEPSSTEHLSISRIWEPDTIAEPIAADDGGADVVEPLDIPIPLIEMNGVEKCSDTSPALITESELLVPKSIELDPVRETPKRRKITTAFDFLLDRARRFFRKLKP